MDILKSFMQEHREEVEDMELLFDPEVYGRIHDAARMLNMTVVEFLNIAK